MRLAPTTCLYTTCLCLGLAISPAWAQPAPTELAEVISVVPILVQEAVPKKTALTCPSSASAAGPLPCNRKWRKATR